TSNYDGGGNDAFYLKLDSTNTLGVGGTFAEQGFYSAPNIRTLLGSPLVVADYTGNNTTLYKCSISSTPCTALSNVRLTDLDTNVGGGGTRIVHAQGREITDMFAGALNTNFTLNNPVVLALDREVVGGCAPPGTFTPVLLNLDKDTKQSFTPVAFNCVQRQAYGNVQVKADGSVGKRVYGQTPAGSLRCLNVNGFDNIVLVRENGTTVTFRLAEKTGYCFLSAIDVK
ncbi:MAG: hypothetical protein RMK35_05855, partial [Aquificaceae bacterium]|nr:hypothetical protein [Aquificaceae bacterium]